VCAFGWISVCVQRQLSAEREREREMERVGGCREPVLCRIGPWLCAWRAFVFRPGRCPYLARARSGKVVSLS
jgi:hypothetical protein